MSKSLLELDGYVVEERFLSEDECRNLLDAIDDYRAGTELVEIHREFRGRALRYSVIEGNEIKDQLPQIWDLYTSRVRDLMSQLCGEEVFPLDNIRAGVNVNIMAPGRSEYRWHYDRTPATAVIYLNEVEGGETEIYPELRLLLNSHQRVRAQKLLDRAVASWPLRAARSRKVIVEPGPGRLLAMRANRAWHSVRGVEGDHDRINLVLAYDKVGASFAAEHGLDSYLYTTESAALKDPNYER